MEKHAEAYRLLKTLQYEEDEERFQQLLPAVLDKMENDPEMKTFGTYFKDYYANRPRTWAYCYRLGLNLNHNNHIESFHRTAKYIYFNGKKIKRVDRALHKILKLVKHKIHKLIIREEKGLVCGELINLRKRHKLSLKMKLESVIEVDPGTMWIVESSDEEYNYEVTRSTHSFSCHDCILFCKTCSACTHMYQCSCKDNAIGGHMCKHIHLVCRSKSTEDTSDEGEKTVKKDVPVVIPNNEAHSQLPKKQRTAVTPERHEIWKREFDEIISSINDEEEAIEIEKSLKAIRIKLRAKKTNVSFNLNTAENHEPGNKKITKQREIYLRKTKKSSKKSGAIRKPSTAAMSASVANLLNFRKNKN